jgi:hypothetical protein
MFNPIFRFSGNIIFQTSVMIFIYLRAFKSVMGFNFPKIDEYRSALNINPPLGEGSCRAGRGWGGLLLARFCANHSDSAVLTAV